MKLLLANQPQVSEDHFSGLRESRLIDDLQLRASSALGASDRE